MNFELIKLLNKGYIILAVYLISLPYLFANQDSYFSFSEGNTTFTFLGSSVSHEVELCYSITSELDRLYKRNEKLFIDYRQGSWDDDTKGAVKIYINRNQPLIIDKHNSKPFNNDSTGIFIRIISDSLPVDILTKAIALINDLTEDDLNDVYQYKMTDDYSNWILYSIDQEKISREISRMINYEKVSNVCVPIYSIDDKKVSNFSYSLGNEGLQLYWLDEIIESATYTGNWFANKFSFENRLYLFLSGSFVLEISMAEEQLIERRHIIESGLHKSGLHRYVPRFAEKCLTDWMSGNREENGICVEISKILKQIGVLK